MTIEVIAIASYPPPVAGQSIATKMMLDHFDQLDVPYHLVDLSRDFHTEAPWRSKLSRAAKVASLPVALARAGGAVSSSNLPVCYLQLGQSPQSMVRDLPLIELATTRGWPLVLHVHGAGFRAAFDAAPWPLRRLVRRAVGRASRAIVLSESLRSLFAGLLPPSQIRVVPNGVERDFARCAAESNAVGAQPGPSFNVLFLSNLIETKGYVTVLEAAKRASDDQPNLKFKLAGGKTETTRVDPDAFIDEHRLSNTEFAGRVGGEEKTALFEWADVLVLPTFYPTEGVPITILEAMHFGLPIVTTRQGGIADIIEHERNGLFVEPRSVDSLLGALGCLSNDVELWTELSNHNLADARQKYTAEAHGEGVLTVLREAAESAGRAETKTTPRPRDARADI